MSEINDLTVVYYSVNEISDRFMENTWTQLRLATEAPIVAVTREPMLTERDEDTSILVDLPRHHLSIYRQALMGALAAQTRYIALAEDDVLYAPEHFRYRPEPGKFAYNMNVWNIFTWGEPMFTQKLGGRLNLSGLICERELFIEAIQERFDKHPDDDEIDLRAWAEPGKYERQLGVTVREREAFTTNPPNIAFSHQTALSFENLGERKRAGEVRAIEIPYWGKAIDILKLYRES